MLVQTLVYRINDVTKEKFCLENPENTMLVALWTYNDLVSDLAQP
jgi:hypothetical protein